MLMATRYGCNMQQIGLCLAIAFILSGTGVTVAQTQAPTPGVKSGNLPLVISLDAADCRRLVAQSHSGQRSEEHTSELQSLMRISYAVFCLKKKTNNKIK